MTRLGQQDDNVSLLKQRDYRGIDACLLRPACSMRCGRLSERFSATYAALLYRTGNLRLSQADFLVSYITLVNQISSNTKQSCEQQSCDRGLL